MRRRPVVWHTRAEWILVVILLPIGAIGAAAPLLKETIGPLWAAVGLIGYLAIAAGGWWWWRSANRWRRYTPAARESFQAADPELEVVADHRDLFGDGACENVVRGAGFTAFEIVRAGRRDWYYALETGNHDVAFRVRPLRIDARTVRWGRRDSRADFWERYTVVSGHLPATVKSVLARSDPELELIAGDGILAVRELGMSARAFRSWRATVAPVAYKTAVALRPARPEIDADAPPSLERAPRNEWSPDSQPDGASQPWRHPPR